MGGSGCRRGQASCCRCEVGIVEVVTECVDGDRVVVVGVAGRDPVRAVAFAVDPLLLEA